MRFFIPPFTSSQSSTTRRNKSTRGRLKPLPFFHKFGFVIAEHRSPVVRGVVVPNALMRKQLVSPGG